MLAASNSSLVHSKIHSLATLLPKILEFRQNKQKIVFTNGCFDILHPGHVDLLARARALGTLLILGLNSDDSVRRQNKGLDRPINTCAVRAFVLAHLESVSCIVEFDEDTPLKLITAIKPDVLVKGGDWQPENIVGRAEVEQGGGTVLSLPLIEGYSTTKLIKTIRSFK